MSNEKQVTVSIPIALKSMINNSNRLLRQYQEQLLLEIEEANVQMMQILNLNPSDGWRLDMDGMVYVRTLTDEEVTEPTAEQSGSKKTTK